MDKKVELITEINQHIKLIRNTLNELHQYTDELNAMLIAAKSLVPQERWESYVVSNLDLQPEMADNLLHKDVNPLETITHLNGNNNLITLPTTQTSISKPTKTMNGRGKKVR